MASYFISFNPRLKIKFIPALLCQKITTPTIHIYHLCAAAAAVAVVVIVAVVVADGIVDSIVVLFCSLFLPVKAVHSLTLGHVSQQTIPRHVQLWW